MKASNTTAVSKSLPSDAHTSYVPEATKPAVEKPVENDALMAAAKKPKAAPEPTPVPPTQEEAGSDIFNISGLKVSTADSKLEQSEKAQQNDKQKEPSGISKKEEKEGQPDTSPSAKPRAYDGPYINVNIKKLKIQRKLFSISLFGSKTILHDVKFALPKGRKVLLIGANGSGKSTLLRSLLGFNKISGSLTIKGVSPFVSQSTVLRELTFNSDEMQLPSDLTTDELFDLLTLLDPVFDATQARAYLAKTQLEFDSKFTNQLSKGMSTILRNAVALARNCEVALFDEPTLGVDVKQRNNFINEVSKKVKANPNLTIVITTHAPNELLAIVDDVIFMFNGTSSPKIPINRISRFFVGHLTKQLRKNSNAIGTLMKPEDNAIKQIFWRTSAPPQANDPVSIEELYAVLDNNPNLLEIMKVELAQVADL